MTLKGKELEKVGITDIASLDGQNLTKFQKRYFQFMLVNFQPEPSMKQGVYKLRMSPSGRLKGADLSTARPES